MANSKAHKVLTVWQYGAYFTIANEDIGVALNWYAPIEVPHGDINAAKAARSMFHVWMMSQLPATGVAYRMV